MRTRWAEPGVCAFIWGIFMAKTVQDDLAVTIADELNKHFKEGKVAFVKDEETAADLDAFISTGSSLLDLAISNRPHGGVPAGRIIELSGAEASGKSLLCAHLIANAQKAGGVGVFIDTETATNWDFFDAVGVDRSKNWVYSWFDTVEDVFESVDHVISTVRASDKKKRPVVIVIDSLAGASTRQEMEEGWGKEGYGTLKAMLVGKALRKITSTIGKERIILVITNQLRQRIGAMPGQDPWITPGGKALAFFSSVRVRLNLMGKIKKDKTEKEVIGVNVKAQVVKNRLGPPFRTAEFSIYFDRGIDDHGSWLPFLREKDIIKGVKSNALTYTKNDGHKIEFGEREWNNLLQSDAELQEEIYLKLCNTVIMSYKTEGLTAADVATEAVSDEE